MKTSICSEALSQFGAEIFAFFPKPDIRKDISNYGVASLIKRMTIYIKAKKSFGKLIFTNIE